MSVSYDQLKRHCVGGCLFYFLSLQGSQSPLNSSRKVILGTRKKGSSILKSCRKRVCLLESGDLEHCSLVGFCICKMGQDTFWLNIQGCCGGSKEVIQLKFTDCAEKIDALLRTSDGSKARVRDKGAWSPSLQFRWWIPMCLEFTASGKQKRERKISLLSFPLLTLGNCVCYN